MKLAGIKAYGMPKVGHGALEGKKVFCSDMTFDATVNPIVYEGGEPVFIDTEYDTWNMDPVALEKAFEIYPDTKVVVIAHLYGTPGKINELNSIIKNMEQFLLKTLLNLWELHIKVFRREHLENTIRFLLMEIKSLQEAQVDAS